MHSFDPFGSGLGGGSPFGSGGPGLGSPLQRGPEDPFRPAGQSGRTWWQDAILSGIGVLGAWLENDPRHGPGPGGRGTTYVGGGGLGGGLEQLAPLLLLGLGVVVVVKLL